MRPLGDKGYLPSSQVAALHGSYASYDRIEDGIVNAVALYAKMYAGLSPDDLVLKWAATTPVRNPSYYKDVRACYE